MTDESKHGTSVVAALPQAENDARDEFYKIFGDHVKFGDKFFTKYDSWMDYVWGEIVLGRDIPESVAALINWDLAIVEAKSESIETTSGFCYYGPSELCEGTYTELGWEPCLGSEWRGTDGEIVSRCDDAATVDLTLLVDGHENVVSVDTKSKIDDRGRYFMWSIGKSGVVDHVRILDAIPTHTITRA
jgi:hypothetical protein